MKKLKYLFVFIFIFLLAIFFRFYKLDKTPPGLFIDEASQGYNAYSLLLTGKDRYGQFLPILFRSFGSFQPPLYTYLTILPVKLFGLSVFSVRLLSALSGIIIILVTYLIVYRLSKNRKLSLISALTVGVSPWSVLFSRIATEANLGLLLFLLGSFFLILTVKKSARFFPFAAFILGMSTHAYYSERITSLLFLFIFFFIYRKFFMEIKKWLILGLLLLILTQIPHAYILKSGAFTRRLDQVTYFNLGSFENNSGILRSLPLGRGIFIVREFLSQYAAYFSSKNLFFHPDPQPVRSMPDISVFFSWMIIPFVLGIRAIINNKKSDLAKILMILVLIGPFPAALAFDPFYTLRVLVFLWGVTVIISWGIYDFLNIIGGKYLKYFLVLAVFMISLLSLYKSLFIFTKYERSEDYGYSYIKLLGEVDKFPKKLFIVDSPRDLGTGIRLVFFKKYDPKLLQPVLKTKLDKGYYDSGVVDELYSVDNVEVRTINWNEDLCKKDVILVGDLLAFSENQVREHNLKFEFLIKDLAGEPRLRAYSVIPESCRI